MVANPGLQAERTDLAWARTGLAFITNGMLVLMHPVLAQPDTLHFAIGGVALALAVFTLAMSYVRRQTLNRRPLPNRLAAPTPLLLIAFGAALLAVATLVVIFSSWPPSAENSL